ncbi:hypothetical protein MP638_005935 [Amoeboaphelidium occidentale]|nr:hypothetical protein MP638_005935 [Amoeboaphelidium occidentale]
MNCAACGKAIEEGGYATLADGSSYHKTCFTCKHCLLPLSNKFAGGPDGFYHPECFEDLFAKKCRQCLKPIRLDEKSFVLGGADVAIHFGCFKCGKCSQQLQERYMEKDGKFYDIECFADLFSARCKKCANPLGISEEYSLIGDNKSCKKNLAGGSFKLDADGLFTCSDCVNAEIAQRTLRLKQLDIASLEKKMTSSISTNAVPRPLSEISQTSNSLSREQTRTELEELTSSSLSRNRTDKVPNDDKESFASSFLAQKSGSMSSTSKEPEPKQEPIPEAPRKEEPVQKIVPVRKTKPKQEPIPEAPRKEEPVQKIVPVRKTSTSEGSVRKNSLTSIFTRRKESNPSVPIIEKTEPKTDPVPAKPTTRPSPSTSSISSMAKQGDNNESSPSMGRKTPGTSTPKTTKPGTGTFGRDYNSTETTALLTRLQNQLKNIGLPDESSTSSEEPRQTKGPKVVSPTKVRSSIPEEFKKAAEPVPKKSEEPTLKKSEEPVVAKTMIKTPSGTISKLQTAQRMSLGKKDTPSIARPKLIKLEKSPPPVSPPAQPFAASTPDQTAKASEAPPPPPAPPVVPAVEPNAPAKSVPDSAHMALMAAIRSNSTDSLKRVDSSEIKDASTPSFLRRDGSTSSISNQLANAARKMSANDKGSTGDLMGELKKSISRNRLAHAADSDAEDAWE